MMRVGAREEVGEHEQGSGRDGVALFEGVRGGHDKALQRRACEPPKEVHEDSVITGGEGDMMEADEMKRFQTCERSTRRRRRRREQLRKDLLCLGMRRVWYGRR